MRFVAAITLTLAFSVQAQKEISPGIFAVGKVRVDKQKRTIEFPAVVNMKEGIVEYFLVSTKGKVHESVLRTDVEPYQIHVAMLLLGGRGAQTNSFGTNQVPRGDAVTVEVSWKGWLSTKRVLAEEMIIDRARNAQMTKGPWIYNGSFQFENVFVAQETGSMISTIADPEALINNPRERRDDDDNWIVNSRTVPNVETLVTVTIKVHHIAPGEGGASNTSSRR